MRLRANIIVMLLALCFSAALYAQPTNILLLGSDHLAQLYKTTSPATDVLLSKPQAELEAYTNLIAAYKPDMITVEVLPEKQQQLDSLYALYVANKLKLDQLPDGRSEIYQLAFRLAKQLGLPTIYCVNAPGGTSQSILDNGDNISVYKEEGLRLRATVVEKVQALQAGKLSFNDYLTFVNQPETYNKIYHLRYITPARVTNGTFKNPDAMVDTAFINPKYIGAELTSVFKNRDYKIYSNIVTSQMKTKAKRVLVLIGVAHLGSLHSIFRDDEAYQLVNVNQYLRK